MIADGPVPRCAGRPYQSASYGICGVVGGERYRRKQGVFVTMGRICTTGRGMREACEDVAGAGDGIGAGDTTSDEAGDGARVELRASGDERLGTWWGDMRAFRWRDCRPHVSDNCLGSSRNMSNKWQAYCKWHHMLQKIAADT